MNALNLGEYFIPRGYKIAGNCAMISLQRKEYEAMKKLETAGIISGKDDWNWSESAVRHLMGAFHPVKDRGTEGDKRENEKEHRG